MFKGLKVTIKYKLNAKKVTEIAKIITYSFDIITLENRRNERNGRENYKDGNSV